MNRNRQRRGKRSGLAPNVSLTPLIDMALTLLVVFMVAAPVAHHAIRVDLPRGTTEDAFNKKIRDIVVGVDQQERYFLDDKPLARDALVREIREIAQQQPVVVFIRVDRRASAGSTIELLEVLRSVEGIQSVAFDIELQK